MGTENPELPSGFEPETPRIPVLDASQFAEEPKSKVVRYEKA